MNIMIIMDKYNNFGSLSQLPHSSYMWKCNTKFRMDEYYGYYEYHDYYG